MLYRLLLAALMMCVPPLAPPHVEAQTALPDQGSMRFEWVREGPTEACGARCREWIAASGPITPDTARDFKLFAEVRDPRGATMVLDSGGGSVLASLELGRQVREFGIRTSVGRTLKVVGGSPQEQAQARLSPRGECASMCVFVLLGGVQREVPPEARILVHQIWPGSKRHDAAAESYTAEEMVRIQRDVGRIARYTVDMGGDIELFELAMRIPPWERLRALSPAELRRLRLQTREEVAAEAPTSGAVAPERPARALPPRRPERGWTLLESDSSGSLTRRHILTIEGDEIGQFELSISCGEPGGPFKLTYADMCLADAADPTRLQDVTLWLGNERLALTVESSAMGGDGFELQSRATAAVPRNLVDSFSKDRSGAMVVGTRTTDNVRTSTRFGGVGLSKAYSRFAEACAK
jgi:hypothetical protein